MAQPTQQFPPWLSPSPFTVTGAAGTPVATDTSIIYVAPTYFGPSIPLGTLYSFGGSSEPPTVILPMPASQTVTTTTPLSTVIPIMTSLTTIATPTTSVSSTVTNTSATPSSSTVLSSSSATTIPNSITSTSTSSTSSSQPRGPAELAGLTKGQLVGVIVASILGLIFLFVLALFLYLWCRGRRNRRNYSTFSQGIDDDYYFVPPGGVRVPGEGSPRHSGEEEDPFLQRSRSGGVAESPALAQSEAAAFAAATTAAAAGTSGGTPVMTQVPSGQSATRQPVARVPPPTTGSGSSASTGSHASGFGVLLDRPSLGIQLPSMEEEGFGGSGRQLSENDMRRIGHESVLPTDYDEYPNEEYTGAYAYSQDPEFAPRLVGATAPLLGGDDEYAVSTPSPTPDLVHQPSLEESATLLTARRVKVEDLGPRTSQNSSPVSAGPSSQSGEGFLGALGLGGLSNIGRLSWFNRVSPRQSRSQDFTIEPFLENEPEKDIEHGQGLLSPADAQRQVDSFGNRARGLGPDGTRPQSGLSARSGTSGGSMYHDAQSSIPGTPLLAAPPRALTPADMGHEHPSNMPSEQTWLGSPLGASGQYTPANSPPGYEAPLGASSSASPMQSPTGTSFDHSIPTDILDMPAPTALGHFASISSLKETPTGSSFGGYKVAPFPPPGLETVRPIGWQHTVGANVTPVGPFGVELTIDEVASEAEHGTGISIDILEEAPPDAQQGWRRIAGPMFVNRPDRGTFGTFVEGFSLGSIMSEHASLHSMRSHLSPSSRSTGSAAASRRDFNSSISSANSARPSAQSSAFSAVAHSLVRQGSLTNDNRHRGISPALSAFGQQVRHGSPGIGGAQDAPLAPVIGVPPSAHMIPPGKTSPLTHRSAGSDATAVMGTSVDLVHGLRPAGSISPLSSTFPLNAPWAGGLDNDWQPTA